MPDNENIDAMEMLKSQVKFNSIAIRLFTSITKRLNDAYERYLKLVDLAEKQNARIEELEKRITEMEGYSLDED